MFSRYSPLRDGAVRLGLVFLLTLASVATMAGAAEPSVRAHLDRGISVIGDPVVLQIRITGARRVGDPPQISVDGLDIQYANQGSERQVRIENGSFSSEQTITLNYQVVPQRNGSFTIPAVVVEADGKGYSTKPIVLTVQPSSATTGEFDTDKIGYAEIVVPKKTLYVGEATPIEVRIYVDSRVRWGAVTMPDLGGEGFTKQKIPEPHKEQVERNGRDYDMLAFKTVIAPIRSGKLTVGPCEIPFRAQVPRARRGGERSPFDIFGDVFSDPFYAVTQDLKAKADAIELTVKPLPLLGKPEDFSGAVGNFEFSAEGSPRQVKIGDPVTMKMRVTGRGNFDRVGAPVIGDATGWRTYPPSSSFNADDQVNYSGTKTFEEAIIPETKKTALPMFCFSFFDPAKGRYVTLNSEAAPLVVEGEALPAPSPASASPESNGPAPAAQPADIIGIRYDRDEPGAFAPLYERREFWFAQGAAGLVLLSVAGLRIRRRPDAAVLAKAALRQEKAAAWRRLRRTDLGHGDFFDAAARVAQIGTALATGCAPAGIDAAAVRSSAHLDAEAAETIDEIFNARSELHYAGGGNGEGQVSAAERERVLGVLRQLENDHARN